MTKCTAACDAEKAVLVKALSSIEVYTGSDSRCLGLLRGDWGAIRAALADTPLAAAALLAQGERQRKALLGAAHDACSLFKSCSHDACKNRRAALSGEEHAHVWIDARNEVVKAGEMCACGAIRAGNKSSGESPSRS